MSGATLKAGTALDALVAEKVMGWTMGPTPDPEGTGQAWSGPRPDGHGKWEVARPSWSPSTEIAAAWEVVEKMGAYPTQLNFACFVGGGGNWCAAVFFPVIARPYGADQVLRWLSSELEIERFPGDMDPIARPASHIVKAEALPLAICLAALQALAGDAGGGRGNNQP